VLVIPDRNGVGRMAKGEASEVCMPQYDFICRDCGKEFEKFLTMAEYDKKKGAMKCPHCGSKKTQRQWSPFFAVGSKKS
jgi:putative FmdB family regulatory protein